MALTVQPLAPENYANIQGSNSFYNPGVAPQPTYAETTPVYGDASASSASGGGGGGSVAAAAPPPPDLSSYDQSIGNIQAGIDRLPNQQNIGHQNVLDSYQSAYNTLLGQKNATQTTYDQNKTTEGQNYVTNKNSINSGVGSSISAAQRLLGSHGAGGSSAALFNAPNAAARSGGLERNQAGQTYAKNEQGLDTSWNNFLGDWNNSATGIGTQRDNNLRSVDSQVDSTRASLLQQLAGLKTQRAAASGMTTAQAVAAGQPYINQANSMLSQVDNLGRTVGGITPTAVQYTAPSLDSYLAPEKANIALQAGTGSSDVLSPYFAQLLGKKDLNTSAGVLA